MTGTRADQIHQLKELEWLNQQIAIHVREFLSEVCGENHQDVMAIVQKSWPVVCEENGGQILPHTHRNAHISAVYYLEIDPNSEAGQIKFMPSETYFTRMLPFPAATNDVTEAYSAKPRSGQLLIFPANLLHAVEKYTGASPRYSIAYDILLTSTQSDNREMILSHPSNWRSLNVPSEKS